MASLVMRRANSPVAPLAYGQKCRRSAPSAPLPLTTNHLLSLALPQGHTQSTSRPIFLCGDLTLSGGVTVKIERRPTDRVLRLSAEPGNLTCPNRPLRLTCFKCG